MTRITIPLAGQYGVIKDVPPQELPINAWSDAINIRFRDGAAQRFLGEKQVFTTPTQTPYYLQPYNQGGSRWWVHAGLATVYADNGTTTSNITPSPAPSGAIDDRWTGGTLNGVNILNNGKDVPYSWGGTGVATAIAAWPATARCAVMRPFKNVLVALDVTKNVGTTNDRYPHMVKWSDTAVPGAIPTSFDHTDLTKLAGEIDLAEDPGLMVDQLVLGDANIIYKENAMFSMQSTGGADVFRFTRLPGSLGALARGCIAQTPYGHVVLCAGDVVIHTGQGPTSIIDSTMRRWLFQSIDSTNRNRSFVTTNPATNEVWICFPELGKQTCTLAAVWNWSSKSWTIRQLNYVTYGATGQINAGIVNTWAAQADSWQDAAASWNEDEYSPAQSRLLTVSAIPAINAVDVGSTFSGAAFTSSLTREGLAFDAPDRVKLVRAVYPRIDAAVGTKVQIEVGGTMDIETPVVWSAPVVYTTGSTFKADTFASGRFIAIRFMSLDNQPWRVRSYDLDIQMQGGY